MTNAVIAINNLFETASLVTVDSEASGFPKENAYDGFLYDYWQPTAGPGCHLRIDMGSAVSVDLFGFYSSDIYSLAGGICTLAYSDDDITYTDISDGVISTPKQGANLKLSTAQSHRYWRLKFTFTGSEQPKIQHAYLGTQTEMQRGLAAGFAPMNLGSERVPVNSISTEGAFLGRSLKKKPIKGRLAFKSVTPAWMRSDWPTILAALEERPFMILPSPDSYTDEAAFCWTEGNIKTPAYDGQNLMSFSIPIMARIT